MYVKLGISEEKVDYILASEIGATYTGSDSIEISEGNVISLKSADAELVQVGEIPVGGTPLANLLLENEDSPVVWRGPVISGVIQQFWKDVAWGDVDYMFVDMPPGTGDVSLTVFQNLPVDGIVIVTTPQDLVTMIVKKAYNMAKLMNIPVLGIVENMSYVKCPDCGKEFRIFGNSRR